MDEGSKPGRTLRLVPEKPLPPYSYIPGRSPHPLSDPQGHSFGTKPERPDPPDPNHWHLCRPYVYGIDLFNHGYYWEAHEVWEGLWHACGRTGRTAAFLKGLIKLAAAGVKHLEGKPEGVKSHSRRAIELWQEVARSLGAEYGIFMGLKIRELIGLAETIYRNGWPAERPLLIPTLDDLAGNGRKC